MNLRKIIKEEVDGFDWTEDISPYTAMPSETEEPQRTVYASAYDEETIK